jgi:hypothetical protein
MPNEAEEVPLAGGDRTSVVRRGDVVLRETGPWAPTVHFLLRHLDEGDEPPPTAGAGVSSAVRINTR